MTEIGASNSYISHQLDLPFPAGQQDVSLVHLWILASDDGQAFIDRRHLFVDSTTAMPLVGPNDFVLLRNKTGAYTLLAHERANAVDRGAIRQRLEALLAARDLRSRRATSVREGLHISLVPGRHRGRLATDTCQLPARTSFEHALLRLAARHGENCRYDAMQAAHGAESALETYVHPIIRGIFGREYGDMLSQLYRETGDASYVRIALPSYERAVVAFGALGLRHQSRASRHLSSTLLRDAEQLWLTGLACPQSDTTNAALGYNVRRVCGFAIALETEISPLIGSTGDGPFVPVGLVELKDQKVLELLVGAPSPRRRAIAIVDERSDRIVVHAGLSGEMHAVLGTLGDSADYSDVAAIEMACETTRFEAQSAAIHPTGPVTFVAQPEAAAHEMTLRIFMQNGDDLSLRFRHGRTSAAPRTYI